MTDLFPNDLEEVAAVPSDRFVSPPADAVIDRAGSWSLPEPYTFIVRSRDTKTFKTVERSYRRYGAADRFIQEELSKGREVLFYDDETIYAPDIRKPRKKRR